MLDVVVIIMRRRQMVVVVATVKTEIPNLSYCIYKNWNPGLDSTLQVDQRVHICTLNVPLIQVPPLQKSTRLKTYSPMHTECFLTTNIDVTTTREACFAIRKQGVDMGE